MKVRELLADSQITISKRAVDAAALKIWDYDDEFSRQDLICGKCGGKIGIRWSGQWTRLEESDHVALRLKEHVCQSREERVRQLRRDMAQYAIDLRAVHPELTRRQVKIARNKFYRYCKKEENL